MKNRAKKTEQPKDDLDVRDAIIHALYIRLRAERETREAIAEAARAGAAPVVLEAMASDPVPFSPEPARAKLVRTLVQDFRRAGLHDPSKHIEGRP